MRKHLSARPGSIVRRPSTAKLTTRSSTKVRSLACVFTSFVTVNIRTTGPRIYSQRHTQGYSNVDTTTDFFSPMVSLHSDVGIFHDSRRPQKPWAGATLIDGTFKLGPLTWRGRCSAWLWLLVPCINVVDRSCAHRRIVMTFRTPGLETVYYVASIYRVVQSHDPFPSFNQCRGDRKSQANLIANLNIWE